MSETNQKPKSAKAEQSAETKSVFNPQKEFAPAEFKINPLSSAETIEKEFAAAIEKFGSQSSDIIQKNGEKEDSAKLENPVFRELAEPKLPALKRENRARLQMQSPSRLHFYWSVKENPFQTLHGIFGGAAKNYTLVVKLLDLKTNREEISPIEAEGAWWFNVDADSTYRAEIGFYSSNRPFVRLMFSNSVETPRRNPSPRPAADADWAVSADSFAEVLDNSGFTQDAFEVALAGDDAELAESSTRAAFANFFGDAEKDFAADDSSEMRFALLALASGYALEHLREQVSPALFAKLQETKENLSAEKALAALRENFNVFIDENADEETFAPAVFGASSINFPRRSKRFFKRNALPKLSPVSSFN